MNIYSSLSFISQGDAVVSLEASYTGIEGLSELQITLYGESFSLIDIAFDYRVSEFEDWKTDAVLISGFGLGNEGNILKGLECLVSGKKHLVYWKYNLNGLSKGQNCFTRVRILQTPTIFLESPSGTWIERISTHEPEAISEYHVVNKDRSGNLLCVTENEVLITNISGTILATITGLDTPSFVLQKPDGNYLILDSGNDRIVEISSNYIDIIRTFDVSSLANMPLHMTYDDIIQNVLFSGGGIPKVYEITWNDDDYGTLLWEHGELISGDSPNQLNSPYGVSYAEDRSIVYISDFGNNRIVCIDRKTGEIETVDSIKIGDADISFYSPKFVKSIDNESYLVVEEKGEPEVYSKYESSHPALKRYWNNSPDKTSDKDNLPEYNNLLFSPLLHVVFNNASFVISSSSESSQ